MKGATVAGSALSQKHNQKRSFSETKTSKKTSRTVYENLSTI